MAPLAPCMDLITYKFKLKLVKTSFPLTKLYGHLFLKSLILAQSER